MHYDSGHLKSNFTLFFSWLCAFLFQLNPLLGPQLESNLIRVMQAEWDDINPEHVPVSTPIFSDKFMYSTKCSRLNKTDLRFSFVLH